MMRKIEKKIIRQDLILVLYIVVLCVLVCVAQLGRKT